MIYSQEPDNWQDLQNRVATLLKTAGLQVEIGKHIKTPRGNIEIDVWAQDNSHPIPIVYIIECKNWNKKIPQTVAHSLTTVMHETGANIGFLISKFGVQSGATNYLQHTNIKAMSYSEFESLYIDSWWSSFMGIGSAVYGDRLLQYTEPINSFRQRKINSLSNESVLKYNSLREKYYPIAYFFSNMRTPPNFIYFKDNLKEVTKGELNIKSNCYSDSLVEIKVYLEGITKGFDVIFGEKLFS